MCDDLLYMISSICLFVLGLLCHCTINFPNRPCVEGTVRDCARCVIGPVGNDPLVVQYCIIDSNFIAIMACDNNSTREDGRDLCCAEDHCNSRENFDKKFPSTTSSISSTLTVDISPTNMEPDPSLTVIISSTLTIRSTTPSLHNATASFIGELILYGQCLYCD